jgi:hypothetical protein
VTVAVLVPPRPAMMAWAYCFGVYCEAKMAPEFQMKPPLMPLPAYWENVSWMLAGHCSLAS